MSKYDELVEFRNKLTNDTDCVIFEEDCQLLDRILDDLEQKDRRIAELESEKQTDLGYIDTYETVYYGKEINKLAEYENTGLEPSEVEQLKANQNKIAIEKEEVLKFIYGNKWTNIELCVDNIPQNY